MTQSIYDYEGQRQGNLLDTNNGIVSRMRYYAFANLKKSFFGKLNQGKATTFSGKMFERKHHSRTGKLIKKITGAKATVVERTNTKKDEAVYAPTA